ncbi:MAG: hypothetical protein RIG82_08425 [Phycisphaeraceae bacterium]
MVRISERRERAVLADLIRAESDWVGIAEKHRLSTSELAEWAAREPTVRRLTALSTLADLQTQLLLGRCRLMAASRLLTLASADETGSAETARKACVDLLKLDRHPQPPHTKANLGALDVAGGGGDELDQGVGDLAALLYGEGDVEGEGEGDKRVLVSEALDDDGSVRDE